MNIATIYRTVHSSISELTWMKHISLDFGQLENSQMSSPWNPPACFIRFETQDISPVGNHCNQVTTYMTVKFVMKDFSKQQLLCLDYSVMLGRKINNVCGSVKVSENYFIDQDVNYVMEYVFRIVYMEDMNSCEDLTAGTLDQINLGLKEVDDISDNQGEGFAKDGIDIS